MTLPALHRVGVPSLELLNLFGRPIDTSLRDNLYALRQRPREYQTNVKAQKFRFSGNRQKRTCPAGTAGRRVQGRRRRLIRRDGDRVGIYWGWNDGRKPEGLR